MRTLCIWHLQYLQSFRNGCLFCTYWLIRNLNCAHSHHASYGERCSNHHFRHWAQCVSEIYSVLKLFEIAVCFAHFGIFKVSTAVRRLMLTIPNRWNHHFQHCAHCVYEIYSIFKVFEIACLFCTFCCFRNLNSAGYGKRCSNHHFQHCAQCVYEIYSVFKVFEIAVCFAHFGLFEISTPVMSNMLTIANIV